MQARVSELDSALDKSKNMCTLLNNRLADAEARSQKAAQSAADMERKVTNMTEETALHKSQCASLAALVQDTEGRLSEATKGHDSTKVALEEAKRKVTGLLWL